MQLCFDLPEEIIIPHAKEKIKCLWGELAVENFQ